MHAHCNDEGTRAVTAYGCPQSRSDTTTAARLLAGSYGLHVLPGRGCGSGRGRCIPGRPGPGRLGGRATGRPGCRHPCQPAGPPQPRPRRHCQPHRYQPAPRHPRWYQQYRWPLHRNWTVSASRCSSAASCRPSGPPTRPACERPPVVVTTAAAAARATIHRIDFRMMFSSILTAQEENRLGRPIRALPPRPSCTRSRLRTHTPLCADHRSGELKRDQPQEGRAPPRLCRYGRCRRSAQNLGYCRARGQAALA